MACPPPPDWFYATNPFVLVYAPYSTGRASFGLLEVAIFVAAALAISAGLLATTIARLRRFVLPAEAGRRTRKLRDPARRAAVAPRRSGGDQAMAGAAAGAVTRRQPRALARVAPIAAVANGADPLGASTGSAPSSRRRSASTNVFVYGIDSIDRRLHDPRRSSCNRCSD